VLVRAEAAQQGGGGTVAVGRGSARAAERDDALETDLIAAPRDAMFATRPDRQDAYATLLTPPSYLAAAQSSIGFQPVFASPTQDPPDRQDAYATLAVGPRKVREEPRNVRQNRFVAI
jgi:hypothetical protein